jgi:hypothetical protein
MLYCYQYVFVESMSKLKEIKRKGREKGERQREI